MSSNEIANVAAPSEIEKRATQEHKVDTHHNVSMSEFSKRIQQGYKEGQEANKDYFSMLDDTAELQFYFKNLA